MGLKLGGELNRNMGMSRIKRIDSLELEENMSFQKVEWGMEVVGMLMLVGLIVAASLGYFGKHGSNERTAGDPQGSLWARYENHPRWETRTWLEIHALPSGLDKKAEISIGENYLKEMMVQNINPEPERVESQQEQTKFVFAGSERGNPVVVRFQMEPEKPGRKSARVSSGEHEVKFDQYVLP